MALPGQGRAKAIPGCTESDVGWNLKEPIAYAIFRPDSAWKPRYMLDDYFRQYGLIAVFLGLATAVPSGMLIASYALSKVGVRPQKPDAVKRAIYECGFETLSGKWNRFNFRFYTIALMFVIFDVEVVFLFPWAASFGVLSSQFGAFILVEMLVFVAILLVGWLYAWRKGALEWS